MVVVFRIRGVGEVVPSPKGAPDEVETVKLVEHGDAVDVGTRGVVYLGRGLAYFLGGYEGGGALLKNAIGMEALIFVLDDAVFKERRCSWRSC